MKKKIVNMLLWALGKLGYHIPVVKPVIVDFKSLQRVRAQEIITYHLLDQTRPGVANVARHQVRESLLKKIGELVEVREEVTPDGVKYYCDMLACNFPIVPEP